MATYPFHAILEYGLGDFDDTVYEYEVTDEQLAQIQAAAAQKKYFDETEELRSLYEDLFQDILKRKRNGIWTKILSCESDMN